tara:strand:- start:217 stop:972 length:756 start_codon:yes stop_codon:yes gene_type:complete
LKIGILTEPSLSDFRKDILNEIMELDHSFVFFLDESPGLSFWLKMKYHFKRKRGGYMLIMLIKSFFFKNKNSHKLIDLIPRHKNSLFTSDKPYSNKFIGLMKSKNIDLLINISGFGRMIKKPILDIPKYGTLSFHHGDITKYRGQPSGFWELYNNEKSMSITVQLLSVKLDAGIPIVVKKVLISPNDSLQSLKLKLNEASFGLMPKAIQKLRENYQIEEVKQLGKIYTIPNLRQWVIFVITIFIRKLFKPN